MMAHVFKTTKYYDRGCKENPRAALFVSSDIDFHPIPEFIERKNMTRGRGSILSTRARGRSPKIVRSSNDTYTTDRYTRRISMYCP